MEDVKTGNGRRKRAAILVSVLIIVIGAVTLFFYLRYKATHITTDDAFVEGPVHIVAARIDGSVLDVKVTDNQRVKTGDLLVEIDDADYEVKVREAESALQAEKARLAEIQSRIQVIKRQIEESTYRMGSSKASLELQEANLSQAQADLKRAENLVRTEAMSRERYEKTKTGFDVSVAQVKAAREQLRQAEAALVTQKALIAEAEASYQSQTSLVKQREAVLRSAELNRSYAKIYTPADGYITRKTVEAGNQIKKGQPIMAVVPLDEVWIVANYKETQLEKVRPGQKVDIKVDTYPGKVFEGRVDSIMAGTGAVFSLFPPENATGNYVKVVQRIPVKILLDKDADKEHILRVGMSVVPTISVE